MDIFKLRDDIIKNDYATFMGSFFDIADDRIRKEVDDKLKAGLLWPEPLLQLNPSFASGGSVDDLVNSGLLHPKCGQIFRAGKSGDSHAGFPMQLYRHQKEAIEAAQAGHNYVLTTGTGSGKSLSYIVPIVDHVLKTGTGKGIKAVIVYPMNALANSQVQELEKFLGAGESAFPVRYARYTGQEKIAERDAVKACPPDILLTNYMMLELILTRPYEKELVANMQDLRFLVFDELHTYRGRQGADVALLIRRLRAMLARDDRGTSFLCVGTSATMAGEGTFDEKRQEVARVAGNIFGDEIKPQHVIAETLEPVTSQADYEAPDFTARLTQALKANRPLPSNYTDFLKEPLVVWTENRVGLTRQDGRLERCAPRPLKGKDGLAEALAEQTGLTAEECESALTRVLLAGSQVRHPDSGKPVFAFKLHQFVSKGDMVYCTLEEEDKRLITLFGQKLAPGCTEEKPLFPVRFCRECGKEYYTVQLSDNGDGTAVFLPCALDQAEADEEGLVYGYLYVSADEPWPGDEDEQLRRLPEDWVEEKKSGAAVRADCRRKLPDLWYVKPDGTACHAREQGSLPAWYLRAPFRFCPCCGVSYEGRMKEYAMLASLGTEGRSSATTVLSMSAVSHLRQSDLEDRAKKLLCFTDNRQDASLQAGHFNDFVQTALIRSALCRALQQAGPQGLRHHELPQKIFEALGSPYPDGKFPREHYALSPEARFGQARRADDAFRSVLEYHVYMDLQNGWRLMAPNLEQCGLLRVRYDSLEDLCRADELWTKCGRLAACTPEEREEIANVFLDYLRWSLVISVGCLGYARGDALVHEARQHLTEDWNFEEGEKTCCAGLALFPKAKSRMSRENVSLSDRSSMGRWLKRQKCLNRHGPLKAADVRSVYEGLIDALVQAGLLAEVTDRGETGWQVQSAGMIWQAADGTIAGKSPFRIQQGSAALKPNSYFVQLYRHFGNTGAGLLAHEHTAQVRSDDREDREKHFRDASLPVLYCSPTMELGVDIAQLNAVAMRNVPPTPANYAQRSGRAGRSGQPALVVTYCARGNSHDQYYFRKPGQMVAGSVTPPRISLANEDLLRAHIHALWLSAAGLDLRSSLAELLDIAGASPSLDLLASVSDALNEPRYRTETALLASKLLAPLEPLLSQCPWHTEDWLAKTLDAIPSDFESACERWRTLFRAAEDQRNKQGDIVSDLGQSSDARKIAQRLRAEAEAQLERLTGSGSQTDDFYSYRYFASEGFLPGYNFPHLPLSAFIPGSKAGGKDDTYLQRARFLAISEFGPNSIIYHEGARYAITRVIMEPQPDDAVGLASVKICEQCGALTRDPKLDFCEHCGSQLPQAVRNLFRMRNVATTRRDRITSDEEERVRQGYELVSAWRFADRDGLTARQDAQLAAQDGTTRLASLVYGPGATLWKINKGWRRRDKSSQPGFWLDTVRGRWLKGNSAGDQDKDLADPAQPGSKICVIPYVEDRKNCLLFTPEVPVEPDMLLSLQAALKRAVQEHFQLEEAELAVEGVPCDDKPERLLFIEACEGGAGVLKQLTEDPDALPQVARKALEICHFDSLGNDLHRAPGADEDCMLACYDCLMTYGNQRGHARLDRHKVRDFLLMAGQGHVTAGTPAGTAGSLAAGAPLPGTSAAGSSGAAAESSAGGSRLEALKQRCQSELEKKWLDWCARHGLRLPDEAQHFVGDCRTRPDFWYNDPPAAVYIDGFCHTYPERRERDKDQQDCLENRGIMVIRFSEDDQWLAVASDYKFVFGKARKRSAGE